MEGNTRPQSAHQCAYDNMLDQSKMKGQGQHVLGKVDLSKVNVQCQNVGKTYGVPHPSIDHAAEAGEVMNFLKTIRNKHRTLRDGSHNQQNGAKWLAALNEEMLVFFNANKRKFTTEVGERTMMIEKERQEDLKVIQHLEAKTTKLENDLKEALQAKEHALNRLSEIHSRLLKLGNPGIADLSDKNRPTNLGQRFKQLYEDKWTDAFEFLTDTRDPRIEEFKAIEMLYEMLKRCKEVCLEGLTDQQSSLAKLVTNPPYFQKSTNAVGLENKPRHEPRTNTGNVQNISVQPFHQQRSTPSKTDFSQTMPPEPRPASGSGGKSTGANERENVTGINKNAHPRTNAAKKMSDVYEAGPVSEPSKPTADQKEIQEKYGVIFKEFSKSVADGTLEHLSVTDILSAINKDGYFHDDIIQNTEVTNYVIECFHITWLMFVQYPPMLMDFDTKPGKTFDYSTFDVYTTKGPTIAKVVWPPVYLHKEGPLVCKGYAEGLKKQ